MEKNKHPIKPGVGDRSDLQVFLHEDSGKSWFPQVNAGWYYSGGVEDYLYASEGNEEVIIPQLSGSITLYTCPDLKLSTKNGPIIIDSDTTRYTRLYSNLSVFNVATPTPYLNQPLMYLTPPGRLVLLTGADGIDMISVPGTGFLQERNYYYYDSSNNKVWISRNLTDPNRSESLYLTYLKDSPGLLQEEILLADSDGNLRTRLGEVFFNSSTPAYNPTLVSPVLGTFYAAFASGNVIYPSIPIAEGTRVGVKYYVNYSYCISYSASTDYVFGFYPVTSILTFAPSGEPALVRWENSVAIRYKDINTLELNPLYEGVSPGFIYLSQPRHPAENLSSIKVRVSPLRVINKYRQPIRIVVSAADNEGYPLSNVSTACWVVQNTDPTSFYPTIPLGDIVTDYKGQVNYFWESKPQLSGSFTVYASGMSASGSIFIDSCSFSTIDPPILTDMVSAPKCFLYLNPNKDATGLQDLYIYMTTQSGIPFPQEFNIRVKCNLGMLYYASTYAASGNNQGSKELIFNFSQAGITGGVRTLSCRYAAIDGDIIIATPADNLSSGLITQYKFDSYPLKVFSA